MCWIHSFVGFCCFFFLFFPKPSPETFWTEHFRYLKKGTKHSSDPKITISRGNTGAGKELLSPTFFLSSLGRKNRGISAPCSADLGQGLHAGVCSPTGTSLWGLSSTLTWIYPDESRLSSSFTSSVGSTKKQEQMGGFWCSESPLAELFLSSLRGDSLCIFCPLFCFTPHFSPTRGSTEAESGFWTQQKSPISPLWIKWPLQGKKDETPWEEESRGFIPCKKAAGEVKAQTTAPGLGFEPETTISPKPLQLFFLDRVHQLSFLALEMRGNLASYDT